MSAAASATVACTILLRREGFVVNHKRLFRLYREERLMVRRRGGRKRAMGTRAPMTVPSPPNDRWSLDFVSDQLLDGRRFRILAWSTTAPESAWRWSPTPRSPASGWRASSTGSSPSAAGPRRSSATTAPS